MKKIQLVGLMLFISCSNAFAISTDIQKGALGYEVVQFFKENVIGGAILTLIGMAILLFVAIKFFQSDMGAAVKAGISLTIITSIGGILAFFGMTVV